jgi:hypothetical protein
LRQDLAVYWRASSSASRRISAQPFEFWPDLERAWQSTSEQAGKSPGSASGESAGGRWRIINTESRRRVQEVVVSAGGRVADVRDDETARRKRRSLFYTVVAHPS